MKDGVSFTADHHVNIDTVQPASSAPALTDSARLIDAVLHTVTRTTLENFLCFNKFLNRPSRRCGYFSYKNDGGIAVEGTVINVNDIAIFSATVAYRTDF